VVEIVERVLSSRTISARELLVPLSQTLIITPEIAASDALALASKHRRSSLVVASAASEPREFLGVLDLTALPAQLPADRQVQQHMRSLERVDSGASALFVLQRLRTRNANLALVLDGKAGTPLGVITEEDLVARLLPQGKPGAAGALQDG
jgi:CBS domain containing-hemolysin-like protein